MQRGHGDNVRVDGIEIGVRMRGTWRGKGSIRVPYGEEWGTWGGDKAWQRHRDKGRAKGMRRDKG